MIEYLTYAAGLVDWKREFWLFNNREFYEAVKDIMGWGALEIEKPRSGYVNPSQQSFVYQGLESGL